MSLSSIFSASTWQNIKSKDSFEKLRTSRIQNSPSFLILVKIWSSYEFQKTIGRIYSATIVSSTLTGSNSYFRLNMNYENVEEQDVTLTRRNKFLVLNYIRLLIEELIHYFIKMWNLGGGILLYSWFHDEVAIFVN